MMATEKHPQRRKPAVEAMPSWGERFNDYYAFQTKAACAHAIEKLSVFGFFNCVMMASGQQLNRSNRRAGETGNACLFHA